AVRSRGRAHPGADRPGYRRRDSARRARGGHRLDARDRSVTNPPTKGTTMKLRSRPLITLLAVGTLALTAGCSSAGAGPDSDGDAAVAGGLPMTITTEFSTEVDEAAAALLPEDVLDRGKIRVAMGVPYPPFVEYAEDDKLIGLDVDMVAALSAKLGIPFEVNHQVFESVIPSLQSDRHDLIMMGMNDSMERQKTLNFRSAE